MPTNVTFNIDCIEYMRDMPTDFFNLAIVDPPYGIADSPSRHKGSGTLKNRILNQQADKFAKWDIPPIPPIVS